jgi:hypothetical protein
MKRKILTSIGALAVVTLTAFSAYLVGVVDGRRECGYPNYETLRDPQMAWRIVGAPLRGENSQVVSGYIASQPCQMEGFRATSRTP